MERRSSVSWTRSNRRRIGFSQELFGKISGEYARTSYRVTTELLRGDPAFAILDAAARHQTQMIVIGSRGMKATKRFFLGSVSEKVLVHAFCSVLIVR